ncbi:hypothetical protein PIROE2DRAFT_17013 [Piromyces sp. E2]|nr:hypothetical protein PIROE2DRAFT_17013 [Piromyces sp. E2]|eukprot:OUM57873.1 hypothetical protein PIROE2DRAFT_17013 [Piromyces sp. E2]
MSLDLALEAQRLGLESQRHYFMGNRTDGSYFEWVFSKGTSFECYVQAMSELDKNHTAQVNGILRIIRTIVNACIKPFNQTFFYWTLLLCIIHKFNFKKPVMKLVLGHFVFRTIGDIIETIGTGLLTSYYAVDSNGNCVKDVSLTEMHPLKFFLTRQINLIFWYVGEIIGDWYPLLRTRAVARDKSTTKWVYIACGLFNFSKIFLYFYHWRLDPRQLYKSNGVYNKDYVDVFYNYYWLLQCVIIGASLLYDISVYLVLRKQLFSKTSKNEFGFLKKFRSISEYRIVISAVIGVFGLPIALGIMSAKFYYCYVRNEIDIDFNFEDLRTTISNVQYFMIFIDQILLIRSKDESTIETFNSGSGSGTTSYNNYGSSYSLSYKKNNFDTFKKSNYDSKSYYSNLSNLNGSNNTLTNNAQNGILQYNYSNSLIGGSNFGMLKNTKYNEINDKDWNY